MATISPGMNNLVFGDAYERELDRLMRQTTATTAEEIRATQLEMERRFIRNRQEEETFRQMTQNVRIDNPLTNATINTNMAHNPLYYTADITTDNNTFQINNTHAYQGYTVTTVDYEREMIKLRETIACYVAYNKKLLEYISTIATDEILEHMDDLEIKHSDKLSKVNEIYGNINHQATTRISTGIEGGVEGRVGPMQAGTGPIR